MLATELLKGQGLGNALFCYITTRALAKKRNVEFSILGKHVLEGIAETKQGLYFMNLNFGMNAEKTDFSDSYQEKEDRIFLGNSTHDRIIGCYVAGADKEMLNVHKNTILYGNMQAEDYFIEYKDDVKKWLAVKPEYDSHEYTRDNLCIINIRGREYTGSPELYLKRSYWKMGIKHMKKIRSDMEFMIVTDDLDAAHKILPEIPSYHFSLDKDYATIKNARHLLLSNSSFAFFPVFTSETVQTIIAPKFWARYNVSDGYWASEQNIYSGWTYMDRCGRLFTDEECRTELKHYKESSGKYKRVNLKPDKLNETYYKIMSWFITSKAYLYKIVWGVVRKCKKRMGAYNYPM